VEHTRRNGLIRERAVGQHLPELADGHLPVGGHEDQVGLAVTELKQKVEASRQAMANLYLSITEHKKAQAEEEIAQLTLRRQFANNYLDARRTLGKETAERLFPKVSGWSIIEVPPVVEG